MSIVRLLHFINSLVSGVIGTTLTMVLVFLIRTKTAKEMKDYSHILLQSSIVDMLLALTSTFIDGIMMAKNGRYYMVSGLLFQHSPVQLRYVVGSILGFMMVILSDFNSVMFLYRYVALTSQVKLTLKVNLLILTPIHISIIFFICFITHMYPSSDDIMIGNKDLAGLLTGPGETGDVGISFVFGMFKPRYIFIFTFLTTIQVINYITIIVCTYKIRKFLKSIASSLTEKTREVQNQLSTTLLFQTLSPIVFISFPYFTLVILTVTNLDIPMVQGHVQCIKHYRHPQKNLEIGYSIAMSTIFFLSTIMFIYVLWMIFTKSPKEMKIYKFYLINYQIQLYIWEILVGFLRPLFFIDNDGFFICLAGFSLFNFSLPLLGCYLLCFGMFFVLTASIFNLTTLVLYRYMQSTDNDFLRKYLDDMKNSIFVHLISYLLTLAVGISPIHIQAMQTLISGIAIQEKFPNQIVVGIKSLSLYTIIINIIFASMLSSTFTYCVLSVLKTLRIHKTTLSAKTFKLFRGLINAILFDIALLMVFAGLPSSVVAATIIFFPQYSLLVSTVIVIFIALLPLATEIVLVLCIPPYFRATKSLFRKIFKKNAGNQVTQINIRVVRASVQSTSLI